LVFKILSFIFFSSLLVKSWLLHLGQLLHLGKPNLPLLHLGKPDLQLLHEGKPNGKANAKVSFIILIFPSNITFSQTYSTPSLTVAFLVHFAAQSPRVESGTEISCLFR